MSVFDSKEFKRLQAEWYQKLKDEDFKDHESAGGYLRGTEQRTWERALADRVEREAYYEQAAFILLEFEFQNDQERAIWALHVDGLSTHKIAKATHTPVATVKWKIKQVRLRAQLGGNWKRSR
jgi:DNA-directed RNA polymerase specialized sigma24 family protein